MELVLEERQCVVYWCSFIATTKGIHTAVALLIGRQVTRCGTLVVWRLASDTGSLNMKKISKYA